MHNWNGVSVLPQSMGPQPGDLHNWHHLESSRTGLTPVMTRRRDLAGAVDWGTCPWAACGLGWASHSLAARFPGGMSSKGENLESISRDEGEGYKAASDLASETILASFLPHSIGYK